MANNRYTERMREKERLQSQGREQRRAQRQEFENQRRQAFQQGVLERRARAEEFRGMAAGVPAGTGINTLANRQQYVVGGKLPEGMEAPARPSYVAAAARGQSLPEYEATQQAARQQRMAIDLAREQARVPLMEQQLKGQQRLQEISAQGAVDERVAAQGAGFDMRLEQLKQSGLSERQAMELASRERVAGQEQSGLSERQAAELSQERFLAGRRQEFEASESQLQRAHEAATVVPEVTKMLGLKGEDKSLDRYGFLERDPATGELRPRFIEPEANANAATDDEGMPLWMRFTGVPQIYHYLK